MCGIAGFIGAKNRDKEQLLAITVAMTDSLVHRGPDDSGTWVDENAGVALGHRRLSIIDLSAAGHQPMLSHSGRYVIAYNGEIYNFRDVRKELEHEGADFRGDSDTEVLLTAIDTWGIENAVKRLVGMFAFVLWDREQSRICLGRDRLGEKPLYYGWQGNTFMFASELKALKTCPDWQGEINRDAMSLYMRHNYIPAPYSIYKNVYKLLPGKLLFINRETRPGHIPEPVTYWSAKDVAEFGEKHQINLSESETIDKLDELLKRSVREKMISDVPLGAFLSGGIDSSTIVSLMQTQSSRPVRTFTIGFSEKDYNEAQQAKKIAEHLGTEHTELYVTPQEALEIIPRLPDLYDEPFSDSSQIPTCLVSEMTKNYVTVSLSGDGGDELFGGYNRYFFGRSIWNKIRWMPRVVRSLVGHSIQCLSPETWNRIYNIGSPLLPGRVRLRRPGENILKLARILDSTSPEDMYRKLVSHWEHPSQIVIDSRELPTMLTNRKEWAQLSDFTQRMMYLDQVSYMPDDIFTKVDRASMGVSLEVRVPFLDHRVVEFSWQVGMGMKIRNNQGKWLLRQVLNKYVPADLVNQPKTGFGVPIDSWLRGPLKDWAESLINKKRLDEEGFFRSLPITDMWQQHQSGKENNQYYLWDVLMFQAWLENSNQ